MTLPASPTAPKPSRRVLTVLVLATLLAPLLVFVCVALLGLLAAAPLPDWATASRVNMASYHLLLDLLAFALPCMLVGVALGRWLQRDASWCAALLSVLALALMLLTPWEGWANAWDTLRWLLTTSLGPCLLLLPSLGAWLGQRRRAKRHAPSPA